MELFEWVAHKHSFRTHSIGECDESFVVVDIEFIFIKRIQEKPKLYYLFDPPPHFQPDH